MEFLCPNHKRMFADLPLDNQQDLWLSWMEHSRSHSQQQDWDNVIALAGSAFDLACLARTRHPETMHVELTLSAIIAYRSLQMRDRAGHARQMVLRALDNLQAQTARHTGLNGYCITDECIEVLLDASRQPGFFADYLNWPSFPFSQYRVRPARVIH